ncbi:MAG: chaperone NapD [Desulfobacterales bacterium]|jgi:nitrate reductase NapD|nr:chaperone NapD [Desulfobacterales bacterium]
MNISSIVVHTRQQNAAVLQGELASLSGVDVHGVNEDGRIVITIEDTPDNSPADTLMNVQNMRGVLSASLIYNYCDDELISQKKDKRRGSDETEQA